MADTRPCTIARPVARAGDAPAPPIATHTAFHEPPDRVAAERDQLRRELATARAELEQVRAELAALRTARGLPSVAAASDEDDTAQRFALLELR